MNSLRICLASILVAGLCVALSVPVSAALRVELKVTEYAGVKRSNEVVVSGVPLAKGALASGTDVHVETAEGRAIPTQSRVLGKWPDGSTKWLLIQFPASTDAGATRKYYLVEGKPPIPSQTIQIRDTPEKLTVDTGALQVAIPKDRFALFGSVARGGHTQASGSSIVFELTGGVIHDSLRTVPEKVLVEEIGPVRATVKVVGWLLGPGGEKHYRIESRLRFFAGLTCVEGDHTFTVLGGPKVQEIRGIYFDIAHRPGASASYLLPGHGHPIVGRLASRQTASLWVDTFLVSRIESENRTLEVRDRVDGWAVLSSPRTRIGVAVRDFGHLGPKAIEMSADRLRIGIWSPRGGQTLRFGRGRAKTHRILYDFSADEESPNRLIGFQKPLAAVTPPQYFCATGALKALSPFGAPETREYDDKINVTFTSLLGARNTDPRENGMQHFGDYFHGGYGNKLTRGNLEYDTAHALFLHYARSGDRRFYDHAVQCNQHFVDMDLNHETGDQLFHGYSEDADIHAQITTRLDWGHVFTDGPADTWFLTGDERSFEAVKAIADRVATISDGEGFEKLRRIMSSAERHVGWPLLALCRAYEVTGDHKYLAASRKIVEYIKVYAADPLAQYRTGKWWRSWMMDGCKTFMVGAVHEGLGAYYDLTQDRKLVPVIVKSLNWMIDYMWDPNSGGFVYEYNAMNRGHRRADATLNMMVVDAFRSGYEITGDDRYLAVALRAFWSRVREMKAPQDGKTFTVDARTSPHTAAFLWRRKLSPGNLPEPPQPKRRPAVPNRPSAGARPDVLLSAGFDGALSCETPAGSRTGSSVGHIAYVSGHNGQALALGSGGYAWLPAPADLLNFPGSIELWVRLNKKRTRLEPAQEAIFHIEGTTPLIDSLALVTIYDEMRVRTKDEIGTLNGTADSDITAWNPGGWHHVVLTWDHNRIQLFLDGKLQTRADEGKRMWDNVNILPTGPQTRINLGWRFGNWHGDSTIDELTVFGRELTPAEVVQRFDAQGSAGRRTE